MRKIIFLIIISFLYACRIDTVEKYVKADSYKGVVTKIYQDKKNHMAYTFEIKSSDGEIFKDDFDVWPYIWDYAKVGDSIIKPADTLMIIVKKRDNSYKEFFYHF
ncbi:MAG: hypothetical protein JXR51_15360 [Bacteroidales bacterium]|nr:hypothetical protein [Bacteroidales bacterium]MBN2758549.1 hypothetical protein [Bacteroidales bacterium]